ncbi:MAG TPA: hypothetical protein DIT66_05790 [Rhodobiaceae bacterium]|nr:hypothetical protein [Rhodobiaceae bacterium]
MAELTISINSRPFQIMCRDGEEAQVQQLAEELATRVANIRRDVGSGHRAGDSHLLVLTGLTMCNELRDLRHEIGRVRDEIEKTTAARKDLHDRIEELEETVGGALEQAAERVEDLLSMLAPEEPEQAIDLPPMNKG